MPGEDPIVILFQHQPITSRPLYVVRSSTVLWAESLHRRARPFSALAPRERLDLPRTYEEHCVYICKCIHTTLHSPQPAIRIAELSWGNGSGSRRTDIISESGRIWFMDRSFPSPPDLGLRVWLDRYIYSTYADMYLSKAWLWYTMVYMPYYISHNAYDWYI